MVPASFLLLLLAASACAVVCWCCLSSCLLSQGDPISQLLLQALDVMGISRLSPAAWTARLRQSWLNSLARGYHTARTNFDRCAMTLLSRQADMRVCVWRTMMWLTIGTWSFSSFLFVLQGASGRRFPHPAVRPAVQRTPQPIAHRGG